MLNAIYSRCIVLICIVHLFWYDSSKTAMKQINIDYHNSLRRLLELPKHNSASEMFVNLNIWRIIKKVCS